ncbi:UDP-3-O-(3-hydroxymyristoyl)glucosamine N-acyltransferase [Thauera linaloolentis]|uniref:UDP-3-O-acylglucosamine N-acyltransferase n=1 Tax=Thauera linaloolentis (strain DSM 12138 / JCM 21573 / CCUG 41526 / CIP 105981 / IAM 15112 / NBRC 102519 / 47Lol) TaxID=1123367 RepID=N6Y7P5_THAL4|nr:UDP-3-O-(3-hydroxymyristoyl)glucosamine N-acyltransferase [Thauera linaloolentis]ENO90301.1 UDP-3-O-[3-hydroxymyristoyl] glucosamine N-acyltransferase [Thauera linaloolentis 47Lol = DSM 12138]MCM8566210.1 UDP-3-O-(3-hydroxymyristoyl)glucosamine N-acyltransferase [Thauera linaloolentis]
MFRLDELVARLGGEVSGDPAVLVRRVATLDQAEEGDLAFLANRKYLSRLQGSGASAIIVAPDARALLNGRSGIVTHDPYLYFARVVQLFNPPPPPRAGIHLLAAVASPLPPSVEVGAGASIEEDVEIGEDVVVGPGCHIGRGARIGRGTRLAARVTIQHGCVLGEDCIIHSGVVVGSDGFGFAREKDGRWVKIPQVGRVVIGNEVEIGANTTIDRGALDDTSIGDGCKLDNQIQIAHNVRIGENTAIAGCVGIAGSTVIGARCMIGGQAGIIGHLSICDDVVVSAGTLVSKSITRPGVYTASLPLQPHAEWVRNFAHLRHLDALVGRVRALENQ